MLRYTFFFPPMLPALTSVWDTVFTVLFITEVHKQKLAHNEMDLSYNKVTH